MPLRLPSMLVLLATLPAAGQEVMQVTYSWQEVVGDTTVPVSAPNGVVDPGEGARIALHIQALVNGQNAVGQTVSYTPPPPPGIGTVRGIASMIYNFRGDNGAATAAGYWGSRSAIGFLSGSFGGQVLLDGALLDSIGGGQFVAPGGTCISTNPVMNAYRGVWQPSSYSPRTVHWIAEPGTAAQPGMQNGVLVAYGITRPNPNDPSTWYDNLLTKYIGTDFGSGVNIPVAPAPSTAAAVGLISIAAVRRRRPSNSRGRR